MSIDAWIVNKSWTGYPSPTPLANSPYWDELIIQLAINGVDRFIYWTEVTMPYWAHLNTEAKNPAADSRLLDDLLSELNAKVSSTSVFATHELPRFDDAVIASKVQFADQTLWRFSFAPSIDGITVQTTDGTVLEVTRDQDRAGGWLLLTQSRKLVMDSEGRLPQYSATSSVANR
jgi:hypothetical protein